MTVTDKLLEAQRTNDSWACVGLDPVMERMPDAVRSAESPFLAFSRDIVEATADVVSAYKPNLEFWLAEGVHGLDALRELIASIPGDIPVILDAKFNDVGHTAAAYARAAFETLGVDGATANPYLGLDALRPFLASAEHGIFVLARTSNPSAPDLQDQPVGNCPLYEEVARLAVGWDAAHAGTCGLVVGATYPEELAHLREIAPDLPFLIPGVGAQGGSLEAAVAHGPTTSGVGPVINSSRGIIYAEDPRAAAQKLRDRINAARSISNLQSPISKPTNVPSTHHLALALADIGGVRLGDFTLRSGQRSPIYIDLRLLVSHPNVLRDVARAYAQVLRPLAFDRLAAIPYTALPIGTAVSLELGCPLIYPRKEVKGYGTKRAVEGEFQKGERVVVLDDLITTGASKLQAIAPMEDLGLQVKDVVVFIDREQGGREYLEKRGYRLHAVFGLGEILDVLAQHGRISTAQRDEVKAFLAGSQRP